MASAIVDAIAQRAFQRHHRQTNFLQNAHYVLVAATALKSIAALFAIVSAIEDGIAALLRAAALRACLCRPHHQPAALCALAMTTSLQSISALYARVLVIVEETARQLLAMETLEPGTWAPPLVAERAAAQKGTLRPCRGSKEVPLPELPVLVLVLVLALVLLAPALRWSAPISTEETSLGRVE